MLPPPDDGFHDVKENLPPLSLPEQLIVAKVRVFCAVLKYTMQPASHSSNAPQRKLGHSGRGQKLVVLKGQCVAYENTSMTVQVQIRPNRRKSGKSGNIHCNDSDEDNVSDEQDEQEGTDEIQYKNIPWTMLSEEDISNRISIYFMQGEEMGTQKRDVLFEKMLTGDSLKVRRAHVLRPPHRARHRPCELDERSPGAARTR